jgi:Zn-dependent protease
MKFSRTEVRDLVKAWLAVTLAFTLANVGFQLNAAAGMLFLVLAVSAGLGFLLHELAHKLVAQRYHCWAEFRADDKMLLVMLIVSAFGLIFAAPGAVVIQGSVTYDRNGKIALAGPLMNVILALVFTVLAVTTPLGVIAIYGAQINAWLGVFNLLPFGGFDGVKVLAWNRYVWAATGITAIAALLLTFWL